jgi:hypothetical protein
MKPFYSFSMFFRLNRSIGVLAAVLAIVLFAMSAPASAQPVVGRSTIGTLPSGGLSANFKRGSKFTVNEAGVIEDFCVYLDGNGGVSGSQTVRLVAYKDANGLPGEKVLESNTITINSGWHANWSCVGAPGHARVSPGDYWIVLHSGGTAGVIRDYADGTGNWYGNSDNFADGASDPFGAGNAGNGTLSVYMYVTATTEMEYSGRLDVATAPSGGLTANYKRGSQITITQAGRLYDLSAYVDSMGGATGSQDVRYVLYTDANGKPGTKVVESPVRTIPSGSPGFWLNIDVPAVPVDAGRYWLVLHSGNVAGVLRDYGDGPANFYANSDTFSDGASQTFGTGSAGTVTLSAYARSTPGPYYSKTFGRTDIASAPSGGMTANYSRASYAFLPSPDAVLTGFYAYLDGQGGASGSQQLRMALYHNSKQYQKPTTKIVESDVVTIAAGTAPGWVHFPVQPTRVSDVYGFWIAIQSGDTGGVVRNYGDGPANWRGNVDAFADGAADLFDINSSKGTVTLSLYATYETTAP